MHGSIFKRNKFGVAYNKMGLKVDHNLELIKKPSDKMVAL